MLQIDTRMLKLSHCSSAFHTMRTFVMLVILLFCHNKNVRSFDIGSELKSVGNFIEKSFQQIKTAVSDFILPINKHRYRRRRYYNVKELTSDKAKLLNSYGHSGQLPKIAIDTKNTEYLKTMKEYIVLTTPQMIKMNGKQVESHVVLTEDGYFLTIHRIVTRNNVTNQTVLLHHGLLGSSADWILLGKKKSLPYILSDAGYDVWLANARGNRYSRNHISLQPNSKEYWNFSWHEIGFYDLPATIDYIRDVKGTNESINFIGHSMGATALLVLLSTKPIYNKYLRIGILLAPLAFMTHVKGPVTVFSRVLTMYPQQIEHMIGFNGEIRYSLKVPQTLLKGNCKGTKLLCSNPLIFITGGLPKDVAWDPSFTAKLLSHVPAGGSTKTILHYAQIVNNGKFQQFNDFSLEYPLHLITLPIAIITSSDDWIATIQDNKKLFLSIDNPIKHYILNGKDFIHTDFVWGARADTLVFSEVINILLKDYKDVGVQSNEV